MYTLCKLNCPKPLVQYMNELNKGAKVTIKTKFGLSETFETGQTLKQGAVLSPIQFGAMIDEIGNLTETNEGTPHVGDIPVPNAMFVDDIANCALSRTKTNDDMAVINDNSVLRLLKYGLSKSNSMEICKELCNESIDITLGGQKLDFVDLYKYLGAMINDKGDLSDHILMIQKKVIIVTAQINKLIANDSFAENSSMVAINLIKSLLIPVICYGLEFRTFKQADINKINRIFIRALKNIWSLKKCTPNWFCLCELGFYSIDTIIDSRRLMFLLFTVPASKLLKSAFDSNNYWAKELKRLRKKFNMPDVPTDTTINPIVTKNFIAKNRGTVSNNKMLKETRNSRTMNRVRELDSKCSHCKNIVTNIPSVNSTHSYNLRDRMSPLYNNADEQSDFNPTDQPVIGRRHVKQDDNVYNWNHSKYTKLLPIHKVRKLILARSNSLLYKNYSNDKDEPTCSLCNDGSFNLEHLINDCKFISTLIPAADYKHGDLFVCGDGETWSAREEKINLISKCLYEAAPQKPI